MVAPIVCTRTGGRMRRRPVAVARPAASTTHVVPDEHPHHEPRWPAGTELLLVLEPERARRCAALRAAPRHAHAAAEGRLDEAQDDAARARWLGQSSGAFGRARAARAPGRGDGPVGYGYQQAFTLTRPLADDVLPGLCAAGRIVIESDGDLHRLSWEEGPAWRFHVEIGRAADGRHEIAGVLERGGARLSLESVAVHGDVVRDGTRLAFVDADASSRWLQHFSAVPSVTVPENGLDEWIAAVSALPHFPPLRVDPSLGLTIIASSPYPAGTAGGVRFGQRGGAARIHIRHRRRR